MKKATLILSIFISTLLVGCQSNKSLRIVKKVENLRTEKEYFKEQELVKIEEKELLNKLKKEVEKKEKENTLEEYVIFARCKIDGTDCIAYIIDKYAGIYKNRIEPKERTINLKQMKPEYANEEVFLSTLDLENDYKIQYTRSKYKDLSTFTNDKEIFIQLPSDEIVHYNNIVVSKETNGTFEIYQNNAIYVVGGWKE